MKDPIRPLLYILLAIGIIFSAYSAVALTLFMSSGSPIVMLSSYLQPGDFAAQRNGAIIFLLALFTAGILFISVSGIYITRLYRKKEGR